MFVKIKPDVKIVDPAGLNKQAALQSGDSLIVGRKITTGDKFKLLASPTHFMNHTRPPSRGQLKPEHETPR